MSQKAIRNTSGKPTSVESLDTRLGARERQSGKPTVAVQGFTDKKATADNAADKLDRDYQGNKAAQARAEQSKPEATEFDVQDRK